jgi:hypothetical protein
MWFTDDKEFVKSFRVGSKVLIVRRDGNNSDRFLEVVVNAVGGRRVLILIPKGCVGRCWSCFSAEFG